jgi:predicted metal-dependent enzyme (double-stranded beta helix superfamily)
MSQIAPFPLPRLDRLYDFITDLGALLSATPLNTRRPPEGGAALLKTLVGYDDWLPDAYTTPHPDRYQQYLLHADASNRFSVASFVWGPGQHTPVHDHTVWGLIGMLRGAELNQPYDLKDGKLTPIGDVEKLTAGKVHTLDVDHGDIHRVSNAVTDGVSVSIHVYGGNIGSILRSIYSADGERRPFISDYANQTLPNFWNRSSFLK